MKNYICYGGLFKLKYMYIDTTDYHADSLFVRNRVPVDYSGSEWHKEGEPYILIECSVHRKHKANFEKSLEQLKNKMELCGHPDYEEWCNNFMVALDS